MGAEIRPARPDGAAALHALTLRSRGHWDDPPEYLAAWFAALEMNAAFLEKSISYVADKNGAPVGYYSLLHEAAPGDWNGFDETPGWWLDNLFIDPPQIGSGLGTALYRHAAGEVLAHGGRVLYIVSGTHAAGFYSRMGAQLVGERPSIVPSVLLPVYQHTLEGAAPDDNG